MSELHRESELHPVQIAKRLVEADGYLELDMPEHALERLEPVQNAGQFEGIAQFLRGHALQSQEKYVDAATALSVAAELMPEPVSRQVWLELSECYRRAGITEGAVNSLGRARGAQLNPDEDPPSLAGEGLDETN